MGAEAVAQAKAFQARMRGLIEVIEAGAFGDIRHIFHIGIGGSALGPKLLVDAWAGMMHAMTSKSSPTSMARRWQRRCVTWTRKATLVAVASKTFTTTETLLNAESAMQWMRDGGVEDPYGHIIALTAKPEKALEWGVDESRILPFAESVGGRYSLWCSIGFPFAAALGWSAFEEMLEGAAAMDRHFRSAPLSENAPVLAAFADLYYTQSRVARHERFLPMMNVCGLLPDYLQQLEMESNGKSVTAEGVLIDYPSAPITWGGVGTDAQHAVFQFLHQGTHLIPVEFIASIEPGHDFDLAHHETLAGQLFRARRRVDAGQENRRSGAQLCR